MPILIAIVFGLLAFVDSINVFGQAVAVRRYPTDEYYSSLKMFRDGKLPEAQHGMETALKKARHSNEEVGIDAVPVMIRIAECLLVQGYCEAGLAQIEEAFNLAKRCKHWNHLLRPVPAGSQRGLGGDSRGLVWHTFAGKAQFGAFPETWPAALGLGKQLHELQSEDIAGGESVRLDVFEVYLAQARGLWLYNQSFRTISSDLSQTRIAAEAFSELRADTPEAIQRAHHICHGLAMIGTGEMDEAKKLLKGNLDVQGSWNHPLTGVGMLGLAEIAMRQDELSEAYSLLLDASVAFARYEQYEWLTEVAKMLATIGGLERRVEASKVLEQMAVWARPRSYLASSTIIGRRHY